MEPQQWHDNFQQWEEWVYRHRHLKWKQERARRCHCSFLAKYFFYFWRFFRARNQRLRAAWAFSAINREVLLKWSTLVAFRMFRNMMRRERATQRAVLRHWHAEMRHHAAHYQVTLSQLLVRLLDTLGRRPNAHGGALSAYHVFSSWCAAAVAIHVPALHTACCPSGSIKASTCIASTTLRFPVFRMACVPHTRNKSSVHTQVDRQKVKLAALCAMRDHAHAMRAVRIASALQLAQRPLPALTVIAVLTDCPHELWKLLVWRAWRGYTTRRLRLQVLAGTMVASPDTLLLRRAMHAWTLVIADAAVSSSVGNATSGTTSTTEPAESAALSPGEMGERTESGASAAGESSEAGGGWCGVAGTAPVRLGRVVALLPPLWKEPLEKRVIMEAVPRDQLLSSARLKKRMQTMLSVKVRCHSDRVNHSHHCNMCAAEHSTVTALLL